MDLLGQELIFERSVVAVTGGRMEKSTKTGESRRIALGSPTIALLEAHLARRCELAQVVGVELDPNGFVFSPDVTMTAAWHPQTISHRFLATSRNAGVPRMRLHDLRHHSATALVTPDRRTVVMHTLVAATMFLPAAYLIVTSPAVEQITIRFRIEQFLRVLATRSTVLLVPLGLLVLVGLVRTATFHPSIRWSLPGVFVLLAGLNPALLNTMNSYAWGAPWRTPDEAITTFIDSPQYLLGAVYRVLGYSDGRVSMLRLIQHGARLDGEFFPERARLDGRGINPRLQESLIDRQCT